VEQSHLSPKHLSLMGIKGGSIRTGVVHRIPLDAAFDPDTDEPRDIGEVFPGETLLLVSQSTVSPTGVVLACEAHPALYRHGSVSCPSFLDETQGGLIPVYFTCRVKFDLKELDHLIRIYSFGKVLQCKAKR